MQTMALPKSKQETPMSSKDFAHLLVKWATEKKAENIQLYHVAEHCGYADYVMICSGTSDRHVSTIAEHIRVMAKAHGQKPIGVEGMSKAQWALIDFADAVVHVFYEPVREYYDLERIWGKETRVNLGPQLDT